MLDPQGHVTSWNSGAQRIKGYTPSRYLQTLSQFYTSEGLPKVPQVGLETARHEGSSKRRWRVRKDGTRFRANVVIDAIHNDAGELIGFAKVTRDITERYRAQLSLERAQ
jgi:PAS domain S-box-containing protein